MVARSGGGQAPGPFIPCFKAGDEWLLFCKLMSDSDFLKLLLSAGCRTEEIVMSKE
jgi:hypothetical protein